MNPNQKHITELFKQYAVLQQNLLRGSDIQQQHAANRIFKRLLDRFHHETDVSILSQALPDPYFPLGMLEQTIFADVVGMRFYINKRRPDLEPILGQELVEWAGAFLRIRYDIKLLFDPNIITCIPLDGARHRLPSGHWYAARSGAYRRIRQQVLFIRITGLACFPVRHLKINNFAHFCFSTLVNRAFFAPSIISNR
jgi:hypothetical protein